MSDLKVTIRSDGEPVVYRLPVNEMITGRGESISLNPGQEFFGLEADFRPFEKAVGIARYENRFERDNASFFMRNRLALLHPEAFWNGQVLSLPEIEYTL